MPYEQGRKWPYYRVYVLGCDPTRSIVVIWVKNFQTEIMVEIYSKRLVRAIGKVLHMKFS